MEQRHIAQQAGTCIRTLPEFCLRWRSTDLYSKCIARRERHWRELLSNHIFDYETSIGTEENSKTPIQIPEELRI
jgi:hypothetical protein